MRHPLRGCSRHSAQPLAKINCLQVRGASILKDKYSLLMHCIKIKSPVKSLLKEQYVFVGGNIYFFVCYHVAPKRHSQPDYEFNDLQKKRKIKTTR